MTCSALRRNPCSFCLRNELSHLLRRRQVNELDISVLEQSVAKLRQLKDQPLIVSHKLFNGAYNICHICNEDVKGNRFVRVPLLSWANGCWLEDVSGQLACLTYTEELVIAQAHSTKCWGKLKDGMKNKCTDQWAASGNICIHPHEIQNIAQHLP
jgi:hypothetical protein